MTTTNKLTAMTYMIRSSSSATLNRMHGTRGSRTALVREMRRRGYVVVTWPNGERAVYTSREDARTDPDGSQAEAVIDCVDQHGNPVEEG